MRTAVVFGGLATQVPPPDIFEENKVVSIVNIRFPPAICHRVKSEISWPQHDRTKSAPPCHISAATEKHAQSCTHTHLLRTIFANSDVECILRAKNIPVIPDRNGSPKRPEKYRKVSIAIARARCYKLEADPSLVTRTFN